MRQSCAPDCAQVEEQTERAGLLSLPVEVCASSRGVYALRGTVIVRPVAAEERDEQADVAGRPLEGQIPAAGQGAVQDGGRAEQTELRGG